MPRNDRDPDRRALWTSLAIVTVAIGIVVGIVWSMFSAESLKPRLVAAVRDATGRTLTVSGPMGLKLSLIPTLTMDDVTLSNPPGFLRPDMMRAKRMELSLALAPLLERRLEIGHVTLLHPEIQLENSPEGRGNWIVAREAIAASREPGGVAVGPLLAVKERYAVSVRDIRIEDGQIAWMDRATGKVFRAGIPALSVDAPDTAPMTARGTVVLNGGPVDFDMKTGVLDQLRNATEAVAWPVNFRLSAGDASLTVEGQIAHPLEGRGYSFNIDANIPDPAVLAALFPGVPLASMKNAVAHAELRDGGAREPLIPVLRVGIGAADLGRFAAGARVEDVVLTARGDQPMKLTARLAMPGYDAGITGTAGTLAWLAKGASGPLDIELAVNAASARATLKGRIEAPLKLAGYALDVSADVPNPSLLFDRAPRALKSVEVRTRVTDASGPVAFRAVSSAGDLSGEVEVTLRPRPSIVGRVVSKRLDLDVLRSGPSGGASGSDAPVPRTRVPDEPVPRARPAADQAAGNTRTDEPRGSPARAAGAPRREPPRPVFSSDPLPFDLLRAMDSQVSFRFDAVRLGGGEAGGVEAVLSMKDGSSRLAPFTAGPPDRRLTGELEIDAGKGPARLRLLLSAPAVAVRPLMEVFGLAPAASGNAAFRVDLTGTGDSVHAIAASLGGWAGVAVQDGKLDAKLINTWLEQLRPLRIEGGDNTELRCFAMRVDAKDGIATIQPVAFNTAALIVEGGGDIDLERETMALRLRPRTRIGGTGVAVPMRINGPLRAPAARVDMSGSGSGAGGPLGLLLGGKDIMGAAGGGDPCPVALARARDQAPPAEPAPVAGETVAPSPGTAADVTPGEKADAPKPAGPAGGRLRSMLGKSEGTR